MSNSPNPNLPWHNSGVTFKISDPGNIMPNLPPGIYRCVLTNSGPVLHRLSSNFAIPFDIYSPRTDIVDRVWTAFKSVPKNIGVLLNGIKGTGKTLTAQLICNRAIEHGMPVIVVDSVNISLNLIFEDIRQPVVILLEEWEKIFENEEHQHDLLTRLDGTSDRSNKRICLFTSNSTNSMQDTFFNRPGRIRYTYNFDRLSAEVIAALVQAKVPNDRKHLIPSFLELIEELEVLSMDTASTLLEDMILFNETAYDAVKHLGLTLTTFSSYKLIQVDARGNDIAVLNPYFSLDNRGDNNQDKSILSGATTPGYYPYHFNEFSDEWLCLLSPFTLPRIYVANVYVKVPWLNHPTVYKCIDEKPSDWKVPAWANKSKRTDKQEEDARTYYDQDTVYGTGKKANVLVRFERNKSSRSHFHETKLTV